MLAIESTQHQHQPHDFTVVDDIDLDLELDADFDLQRQRQRQLNDFNIAQLQLQYAHSPSSNDPSDLEPLDFPAPEFKFPPSTHEEGGLYPDSVIISPPNNMLDASDPGADYNAARRMSSSAVSAISSTSASATSDSAYSRIGEKRAPSPSMLDDAGGSSSNRARMGAEDGSSPRAGKRPRPTLSLDAGAAGRYSPANGHHHLGSSSAQESASGGHDGNGSAASVPPTALSASDASGASKVQLPPIFPQQLDSPASSDTSIPHSHMHSQQQGHLQQQQQHHHQLPLVMHGSIAGLPGSTVGGLLAAPRRLEQELRRGSLPNLYSDSLSAARQRLPSVNNHGVGGGSSLALSFGPQGGYSSNSNSNSNNASPSPHSLPGSALPRGAFTFSSPLPSVTGELAGYQFPGPSSSASDAANSSQSNSTPSSGYPHTPLDSLAAAHHQQQQQQQSGGGEWISRPSSGGHPLGGLLAGSPPRISGHAHSGDGRKQSNAGGEEWYTPNGSFVVPGGSTGSASSSPQQQNQTAQLEAHHHTASALGVSPVAAAQAAAVAAQVAARPQRRRGKLPKPTTDFLKDWLHRHSDHPYPSEEEKKQLCNATGLSMSQVSNWMINARRRILAPAKCTAQGPTTTVPFPSSRQSMGGMHPHHLVGTHHHPGLPSHHMHGGGGLHASLGFGVPSSSSSSAMGLSGMGGVPLTHPHNGGGYGGQGGGYAPNIFDVPSAMQRRASMPGPVSDLHHHPLSLSSHHHQQQQHHHQQQQHQQHHMQQQQHQQQHPHHQQHQQASGLQLYGTSSAPSGYASASAEYGLRGTLPRPSLPAALPSAGYGPYAGQATTPQRLPSLSLNASPARGYAFPDNGLAGVDGE